MLSAYQHSADWIVSRRNAVAMCGILAGSLLSSCKQEVQVLNQVQNQVQDQDNDHKPNCYVEGTRILTPEGERRIEELAIGDLVTTYIGIARPIKWIARRRYVRAESNQWMEGIKPVRIARSALQANVPHADLFVSQNHCLYLDGMLIRAANLINGSSITLDPFKGFAEIEYLHIMVGAHDIILAQGAPCETLLSDQSVRLFDNSADYERLYGIHECLSQQPYAKVYTDFGRRDKVYSHLRSALFPFIDRRNRFDKLRDRLMQQVIVS